MNFVRIGLIVILAASFGAGGTVPALAAGGQCVDVLSALPQPLLGQFTGYGVDGPDAGLSLSGTLSMQLDTTGSSTGSLAVANGPMLAVSGKVAGFSIQLDLTTADGTAISGHGTLPDNCTGPIIGGQLTGPHHPNRGDWGIIWGS
jgi:hypothetical protein